MNSQELKTLFENNRKSLNKAIQLSEKLSGSRKTLQNLSETATERIREIDFLLNKYNSVVQLFQLVTERARTQIVKVEGICSDALRDILGDSDLTFKFKMEKKRNMIDTTFFIHDKKVGDVNLMKGEAGGTKNVVAVGLRLVFSELYNPKVEGPIILDEAGGNISVEYQESFGKFLKKFSQLTGRQIILVSHHKPVIATASSKITVSKRGGESVILQ